MNMNLVVVGMWADSNSHHNIISDASLVQRLLQTNRTIGEDMVVCHEQYVVGCLKANTHGVVVRSTGDTIANGVLRDEEGSFMGGFATLV